MRLRDEVIGSLNLFREIDGALNGADARAAQALADVATISILQQRTAQDATVTAEQLQYALDAKVPSNRPRGTSPGLCRSTWTRLARSSAATPGPCNAGSVT